MTVNAQPEIAVALPDERIAALTLALQQVPEAQRPARLANALALVAAGDIDPSGILVAKDADQVVGVQVCLPLEGASGLFWQLQVDDAWQKTDVPDRLVSAALAWLKGRGAKLAQALILPDELALAEPLIRCGFQHVSRLQYLCHDLVDVPSIRPMPALHVESYSAANAVTFQEVLLRTYENSLDCPELNGVRTVDEILAGHQAQGIWRPETWWLALVDDVPAGVVMLTELFERDGWDLTYLGLVKHYRGRGLGRALTVRALHALRDQDAARLLVAVDARNLPALQLYESLGFKRLERREVLLRVL